MKLTATLFSLALTGLTLSAAAQAVRVQSFTFRPRKQHRIGTWFNSPTDSVRVYWGGFSGLRAVPGTPGDFYTVTDRGPNVDAPNGNKFFPFPSFAPTIIRYRAQGDSLVLLSYTPIKRPLGTPASGRPLPAHLGATGEAACSTPSCTGTPYAADAFGIDSEAIELDGQGGFWLSEEYGTSAWHVAADGHLLTRYTPWGADPARTPQDVAVDSVFRHREPNKGWEGICRTPNGKIYTFIQSPLSYPSAAVGAASRTHRILELDPATGATRTFFYFHKPAPATSLANDKIYIGDAAAINNNELLVLEHGGSGVNTSTRVRNRKLIYKIDLRTAIPLPGNALLGAEALDSAGLAQLGYQGVRKTLVLDLLANGFDTTISKAENLAIVNDSTLAVGNDNDFGVAADGNTRLAADPTNLSKLYLYTLPKASRLVVAARPALAATTPLYPNPVPAGHLLYLPASTAYEVLDYTGRCVQRGEAAQVPTTGLAAGYYLLRDAAGRPLGRFVVE
ncbi:MAG: esterase-like activity of phytase family protein [Janthinobacterium lividum]